MVKAIVIILVLLALAAGAYFMFFRTTEEALVRQRFSSLASSVGKKGSEGALSAAANSQATGACFADNVSIEIEGVSWLTGSYTAEEIASRTFAGRKHFNTLNLSFSDIQIEITGPDTATASFTAALTGTLSSGDNIREVRELDSTLKKIEGKWKFESFRMRNIIRK